MSPSNGGTGVDTLTGLALGSGTSNFTAVTYVPITSFTPVLNCGGSPTGITYSTQSGYYQQIGNVVYFGIELILSSKGSESGSATITGLPVAAASLDTEGTALVQNVTLTPTNLYSYYQISNATTTVLLYQNTIAGVQSALADTNFANNSEVFITGLYFV